VNTVPLAAGQHVIWQETTADGLVDWTVGSIAADSVSCTCAGKGTWAPGSDFAKSSNRMQLTIPDADADATTEQVCDAGEVVCTVRSWNSNAAPARDLEATCFACDAASGSEDCTKDESAAADNAGEGVISYHADATVTYAQDGTAVEAFLTVKDVAYVPNSQNARGRLSYKPSNTATAWDDETTIAYTFGGQAIGSDAQCQIFAEDSDMRGFAGDVMMSDRVTNCVISGQTVTITLATSRVDFYVTVIAGDAWGASDTNSVDGEQKNFNQVVRSTTGVAEDKYTMVTLTAYGDNKAKL